MMKRTGRIKGRTPAQKAARTRRKKLLGKPKVARSAVRKKPLRDKEHRQRVNTLPCCICGFRERLSEAHHIREAYRRSTGVRIGDDKIVPLCISMINRPGCHDNLHKYSRDFWAKIGLDPRPIAQRLYAETLALRAR